MSRNQEVATFQYQHSREDVDCIEEERELEEALSLSDLPISCGNEGEGAKEEGSKVDGHESLDFDFGFGSSAGSISALDGEMCAADEVFSGGLMLPYRNSVSSMSGLRSVSRSESIDRRGFGSRSSSSRSSSIRSHYSATSSSGSSSCSTSNYTAISAKTVPLVSKTKVVQNQFHSYPSPKPQILGSGPHFSTYASSPIGKRSKMWEVLKLGLVRTPEIELQDLKLRHHRTNNFGKTFTIPRNNSTGSSSSNASNKAGDSNDNRARKSFSIDGYKISDFMLEVQKKKNQLSEIKNSNSGFFKSCKCSTGVIVIEPMPTRPNNYGANKNKYSGNSQNKSPAAKQVLNEDKNLAQKKHQEQEQQHQHQQKQKNNQIRQGKQAMSHHHHRTFEWLRNLSHASVLNNS